MEALQQQLNLDLRLGLSEHTEVEQVLFPVKVRGCGWPVVVCGVCRWGC